MAQPEKRLTWFSPSVLSCHGDWQSISCPFLQCYEARNTLGLMKFLSPLQSKDDTTGISLPQLANPA